jgi:predicted 3-demethylubiquinone-9 3-methyltransferase (glyoxalase superfamily)
MQKITPFLWLDGNVEEAVAFYTSVFKRARVFDTGPVSASFEIEGQEFTAFNGGPLYKFNEAVSFCVRCESQEEVDEYWAKLTAGGGTEGRCGWLKDKYGLSWQVLPRELGQYLASEDRVRADRVLKAMLKMTRIDVAELDAAYTG